VLGLKYLKVVGIDTLIKRRYTIRMLHMTDITVINPSHPTNLYMEHLSGFRKFARNALLTLYLVLPSCASQQHLPEAKLWGMYDVPGAGRTMCQFLFSDKDKEPGYDYLEIRTRKDEEPAYVIVRKEFVEPLYIATATAVAAAAGTTPEQARQAPSD